MNKILLMESQEFWEELKKNLKEILSKEVTEKKEWLRSKDVRQMLKISDSTLQTMRINGTIPSYKLGSSWFYRHDEIRAALEANKIGRKEVSNG